MQQGLAGVSNSSGYVENKAAFQAKGWNYPELAVVRFY